MKKKFSLFVLLPAIMLSSCGNGAEITDSAQVKELKDAISAKAKDIKNGEMTVKSKGSSYDDSTKKNVSQERELTYRYNADDEMYLKSTGVAGEEKSETTVYLVKNEKYQKVLYISSYDQETKKDEITVYGYEGNELTFSFAALYFMEPMIYTSLFLDPVEFEVDDALEANGEEAEEMDISTKYYSKGAGNLTINIEAAAKGAAKSDSKEHGVKESLTATYDNYVWKTAKVESESNLGNKSTTDITFTAKDKVKIELPTGWEGLMSSQEA